MSVEHRPIDQIPDLVTPISMSEYRANAYKRYWSAANRDQDRAAYYEILLTGGKDGYNKSGLNEWIARKLRQAAFFFDKRNW